MFSNRIMIMLLKQDTIPNVLFVNMPLYHLIH